MKISNVSIPQSKPSSPSSLCPYESVSSSWKNIYYFIFCENKRYFSQIFYKSIAACVYSFSNVL
jgi:hypothetical protein